MTRFNTILHQYLLEKAEKIFSDEESVTRVSVTGLPFRLAESLISEILSQGGMLVKGRLVTIVLTDNSIKSNVVPDAKSGGICGKDHILNLRNTKGIKEVIVVLGEGTVLDKSNSTSLIPVGIQENAYGEDWINHDMIQFILKRIFVDSGLSYHHQGIHEGLNDILLNFRSSGKHQNDHIDQWRLLKTLANNSSTKKVELIGSIIGALNGDRLSFFDTKTHAKIFGKISDFFDADGFGKSIDEWIEKEPEPLIKEALLEFRSHIITVCPSPSDFAACPHYYYGCLASEADVVEVFKWWEALTVDVWNNILDESTSTANACKIRVLNGVFRGEKPCPITLSNIMFEIDHSEGFSPGQQINVYHKRGKYLLVENIRVEEKCKCINWSHAPVIQDLPAAYKFEIDGYEDAFQKVISLKAYGPAFSFFIAQADKITFLKKKKSKAKDETWESNLVLANSGAHEIEFVTDEKRVILQEIRKYANFESKDYKILTSSLLSNKKVTTFSIESEGLIEFVLKEVDSSNRKLIKLFCNVTESEPVGVPSILEKLIRQNVSPNGEKEKVEVYSEWPHLHQIQMWMIEAKANSWKPLIICPDYSNNFHRPDYDTNPILTSSKINIDCRPSFVAMSPPNELVELRSKIISIVNPDQQEDSKDYYHQPLIEYAELFRSDLQESLESCVIEYLKIYRKWFNSNSQYASWFDVVALCDNANDIVSSEPYALLLSPFHPLRIGWQYLTQRELYKTLSSGKPCPAAGVLNPSNFPDSLIAPAYKLENQMTNLAFLSLNNSSVSWSLLWNSEKLTAIEKGPFTEMFGSKFGMEIQGLDSGLSSSQVEQTLNDIYRIKSGQSSINIEVHSESAEASMFNLGIKNWVENNLGDSIVQNNTKTVRDIWFGSGNRSLEIYDTRPLHFQPSPEELVDYSKETGYSLLWYNQHQEKRKPQVDLSIISHLSNQSPLTNSAPSKSLLVNGGLSRTTIRYSSKSPQSKLTFTESRTCQKPEASEDPLSNLLGALCHEIESEVFIAGKGCLSSTPKLDFVNQCLDKAEYCAVSSSVVDPSAFFDDQHDNYLWDYDLPSYSNKHGNGGFYLLAKKSDAVVSAIKNSLKAILNVGKVNNIIIESTLREIAGRGIPTLKTLASGGTNASGEIGLLIGMRLLQAFDSSISNYQFAPRETGNIYNLIIPVDPFAGQINGLFTRLGIDQLRPDLLVLSISLNDAQVQLKLTPVEVKFRTTKMSKKDMLTAHLQCDNFLKLMAELNRLSRDFSLWNVARIQLLADMISFAFSTYGRKLNDLSEVRKWTELQEKVLRKIAQLDSIVCPENGRLIAISDYQLTEFENIKNGSITDTLLLSFEDAISILKEENVNKFENFKYSIGDWGLQHSSIDSIPTKQNKPTADISVLNSNKEKTSKEDKLTHKKSDIGSPITMVNAVNNGIKFEIGKRSGALQSVSYEFHPSNTDLNQLNIGIVGDLGTGKTQLIKALIFNIVKAPSENRGHAPKILIIDTKRDYDGLGEKQSDKLFVKNIKAKIVKPYKLPINLFDIRNSKEDNPAFSKAEFFIDILNKIYGGIGPVQENALLNAVMNSFYKNGYEPHLSDYRNFNSPTLRDIFEEYKTSSVGKVDTPYSLMNKLVQAGLFEEDSDKTLSFSDFFDQTTVLSLGGIASNDKNLKMVMIIFLNLFREYMLGVKKLEFIPSESFQLRNIDSYLLIDEANLIMEYELPVLEDLLLKGREFGVGIILSSQYLSHFRKSGTNYTEPLLTWFIHKIPNVTVKELQTLGLHNVDEALVNKIKMLEPHFCLFKSLNSNGVIIEGTPYYKFVETV
jgi:DNA phosphorothioation-dependent restriction protein DptH